MAFAGLISRNFFVTLYDRLLYLLWQTTLTFALFVVFSILQVLEIRSAVFDV